MEARLKMSPDGYGERSLPTGEIEIWDSNLMQWRAAAENETVPALTRLVINLYRAIAKAEGRE